MFVSSMMISRFTFTIFGHAQDDLFRDAVVYFSFGGLFSIGTYYRVTIVRGSPACLSSQRGTHEKIYVSKVIDLWPLCYFNYIQGRHSTKCNVLLCSYTQLQIKKTPEYIILYTILRQKNLHGLRFPTCERRRSSGAKGGFPFSIISGVKSGYTISKLKRSHGILPYTQFSDNKKDLHRKASIHNFQTKKLQ